METKLHFADATVHSDGKLLENFNVAVRRQGFADPHGPDRFDIVNRARQILAQDDEFVNCDPELVAVADALRTVDEKEFTSANILIAVEGKLDLGI